MRAAQNILPPEVKRLLTDPKYKTDLFYFDSGDRYYTVEGSVYTTHRNDAERDQPLTVTHPTPKRIRTYGSLAEHPLFRKLIEDDNYPEIISSFGSELRSELREFLVKRKELSQLLQTAGPKEAFSIVLDYLISPVYGDFNLNWLYVPLIDGKNLLHIYAEAGLLAALMERVEQNVGSRESDPFVFLTLAATDEKQRTPLHCAAASGGQSDVDFIQEAIRRAMLASKAAGAGIAVPDYDARDADGKTAVELARAAVEPAKRNEIAARYEYILDLGIQSLFGFRVASAAVFKAREAVLGAERGVRAAQKSLRLIGCEAAGGDVDGDPEYIRAQGAEELAEINLSVARGDWLTALVKDYVRQSSQCLTINIPALSPIELLERVEQKVGDGCFTSDAVFYARQRVNIARAELAEAETQSGIIAQPTGHAGYTQEIGEPDPLGVSRVDAAKRNLASAEEGLLWAVATELEAEAHTSGVAKEAAVLAKKEVGPLPARAEFLYRRAKAEYKCRQDVVSGLDAELKRLASPQVTSVGLFSGGEQQATFRIAVERSMHVTVDRLHADGGITITADLASKIIDAGASELAQKADIIFKILVCVSRLQVGRLALPVGDTRIEDLGMMHGLLMGVLTERFKLQEGPFTCGRGQNVLTNPACQAALKLALDEVGAHLELARASLAALNPTNGTIATAAASAASAASDTAGDASASADAAEQTITITVTAPPAPGSEAASATESAAPAGDAGFCDFGFV